MSTAILGDNGCDEVIHTQYDTMMNIKHNKREQRTNIENQNVSMFELRMHSNIMLSQIGVDAEKHARRLSILSTHEYRLHLYSIRRYIEHQADLEISRSFRDMYSVLI
jgi:hypothetical protein